MSKAFFDIETDGLDATRVHCICAMLDNDESTVYNFIGEDNGRFFEDWLVSEGVQTLVGHNIINFDIPVLRDVSGSAFDFNLRDTLILSRLASPNIEGGHSLRNWGLTLGEYKGDYEGGWDEFNFDMLEYCKQDVRVTKELDKWMVEAEKLGNLDKESIDLEHRVAELIKEQEDNGVLLKEGEAYELLAVLKEKVLEAEDKVRERFKPLPVWIPLNHPEDKTHNKDGSISKRYQSQLDKGAHFNDDGEWGYNSYPEFNLGSTQQRARHLQHFGWKPTEFTDTGQPKVDEKILKGIKGIPEAGVMLDYMLANKRVAMVKGWIESLDDKTGRVHGRVNTIGAVTGRMTHSKPNMAQVPAVKKDSEGNTLWGYEGGYGADCRDLWTVPEGYALVGCDASGLELRMLAHYMNDKNYTEEILNGDIHTANQRASGVKSRDQAKTFIYAFLYGAGDEKIGQVVGGTAREGKVLKKNFLDNTPALASLRRRVTENARKGWLYGLDKRKLYVRSEHSALNTLLQGAGAVVMKKALVLLAEYAKIYNIDYKFVLNVHDEFQCEVREDQAEFFGSLAVGSIIKAGKSFKLNCPLDGEYKVGKTWQQTH